VALLGPNGAGKTTLVLHLNGILHGGEGSVEVGGLELDAGPDAFVARRPWAVELCRELGLELREPAVRGTSAWTERGLVPLPPIVAPDKSVADFFASVHGVLAATLAALLVAHVGAALRHHFVKRNAVLARMLPGTRRAP